jgi:hypothetical protein
MTRQFFLERTLRQIYNGQPNADSNITVNLVNTWLNDAIGLAAAKNYKDSYAIDGINYINNSFYTTFKGLVITKDENFLYKVVLPQIPFGIGRNEGISTLQFKGTDNNLSHTAIPLSTNQVSFQNGMRPITNKLLYYIEGGAAFVFTVLNLTSYTASVRMVSGGDSTNLTSTLNVPDDFLPFIVDYIQKQLLIEHNQPIDVISDGVDNTQKQ